MPPALRRCTRGSSRARPPLEAHAVWMLPHNRQFNLSTKRGLAYKNHPAHLVEAHVVQVDVLLQLQELVADGLGLLRKKEAERREGAGAAPGGTGVRALRWAALEGGARRGAARRRLQEPPASQPNRAGGGAARCRSRPRPSVYAPAQAHTPAATCAFAPPAARCAAPRRRLPSARGPADSSKGGGQATREIGNMQLRLAAWCSHTQGQAAIGTGAGCGPPCARPPPAAHGRPPALRARLQLLQPLAQLGHQAGGEAPALLHLCFQLLKEALLGCRGTTGAGQVQGGSWGRRARRQSSAAGNGQARTRLHASRSRQHPACERGASG